jgi:hypothetical protein
MYIGAALLLLGAIVNAIGIRNPSPKQIEDRAAGAETEAASLGLH